MNYFGVKSNLDTLFMKHLPVVPSYKSNAPLWRQLVQAAADDGRGSLCQGGVAGVGRDGEVVVRLGGEGGAAERGRSLAHGAVTRRVSGEKRLRQPLRPGELVAPAGGNRVW